MPRFTTFARIIAALVLALVAAACTDDGGAPTVSTTTIVGPEPVIQFAWSAGAIRFDFANVTADAKNALMQLSQDYGTSVTSLSVAPDGKAPGPREIAALRGLLDELKPFEGQGRLLTWQGHIDVITPEPRAIAIANNYRDPNGIVVKHVSSAT